MNKAEKKKSKKRPFGESQSAKPGQKQENAFKKNFKKPKLSVSPQNGDFKAEMKGKPFKVDKQKQQKNAKQDNTMEVERLTPPRLDYIKEKPKQKNAKQDDTIKIEQLSPPRLDYIDKKQKKQQQQSPGKKSPKKELTVEQIKQKIIEIQNRENLSKTGAKKLYNMKKLLAKMTGGKQSEKSITGKKNIQKANENAQAKKQKVNDKGKAKAKPVIETKHETEEDDDDDEDDDYNDDDDINTDDDDSESDPSEDSDEEEEVEEEEDNLDEDEVSENVLAAYKYGEKEPMNEEVDEEESESESEDDETDEDASDDEDEISDEMDDEEDDEADTDDESFETKEVVQFPKKEDSPEKSRYTFFMKNLPDNITDTDLLQHLQKTLRRIISITRNRNFAIVVVPTKAEYEKALSLDQTKFKGKVLRVKEYVSKKPLPSTKKSGDPKSGKNPKDSKMVKPWMEFKKNKKPQQKKGKGQNN